MIPISQLYLFCDGSVHNPSRQGCGASLVTADIGLNLATLALAIRTRTFTLTSSTRLELQTLLWALSEIPREVSRVVVFTDSQNIIGLPGRRARLEAQQFCSRQGKLLANADLYRSFFTIFDRLPCELIKVKGHSRASEKSAIEKIFALVDQAARRGSRELGS